MNSRLSSRLTRATSVVSRNKLGALLLLQACTASPERVGCFYYKLDKSMTAAAACLCFVLGTSQER